MSQSVLGVFRVAQQAMAARRIYLQHAESFSFTRTAIIAHCRRGVNAKLEAAMRLIVMVYSSLNEIIPGPKTLTTVGTTHLMRFTFTAPAAMYPSRLPAP